MEHEDHGESGDRNVGIRSANRGLSEVIGIVILLGLVIVGAVGITLLASPAIEEVQEKNQLTAAQKSMVEVKSQLWSVSTGKRSAMVGFEFDPDGDSVRMDDSGRIELVLNGVDACTASRDLGVIRYSTDDGDTVAYQAGGVWKSTGTGEATMVSAPPIDYRTQTLDGSEVYTLNYDLVNVNATKSNLEGQDRFVARPTGGNARKEMNRELCLAGPNASRIDLVHNVTIRVTGTEYYQAWNQFLHQKFGDVTDSYEVYDRNRTVIVRKIPLGTGDSGPSGALAGGETDTDDDGWPNSEDDCPSTPANGKNGCPLVSIDRSANALAVNGTGATLTLAGTAVAEKNATTKTITKEVTVEKRKPLDVAFVLDGTGSMMKGRAIGSWHWGFRTYSYPVPRGQVWELYRDTDRDRNREFVGYYKAGQRITLQYGDVVYQYRLGNDPYEKRIDATRGFIGALNDSKDRAALVEFRIRRCGRDSPERCASTLHPLSGSLDGVNRSLGDVHSRGATYIGAGIKHGIGELGPSTPGKNRERVMVLLSDGANDPPDGWAMDKDDLDERTLDWVDQAARKNITIYTVALGEEADSSLLAKIADRTGGKSYNISTASQLEDVFDRIVGETKTKAKTKTVRVRRIDYNKVKTEVRINGRSKVLATVNTDTPESGTPSTSISFDSGSLVSIAGSSFDCGSGSVFDQTNHEGTIYNETKCANNGQKNTANNSSARLHSIYLDGDRVNGSLRSANLSWFKSGITQVITDYDPDLIDDGRFNLSPGEAVFVLKLDTGGRDGADYAVVHFQTTPPSPPGVDDGFAGKFPVNRFVINIGGSQVAIGDETRGRAK